MGVRGGWEIRRRGWRVGGGERVLPPYHMGALPPDREAQGRYGCVGMGVGT